MKMEVVLDRSDNTINDYWFSFDILKGINNISAVEVILKEIIRTYREAKLHALFFLRKGTSDN